MLPLGVLNFSEGVVGFFEDLRYVAMTLVISLSIIFLWSLLINSRRNQRQVFTGRHTSHRHFLVCELQDFKARFL